jgi:PGF-CTERM protein/uncharacterized repeat protein (TIGR01451 family)
MVMKNTILLKYIIIVMLYVSSSCVLVQAWENDDLIYWTDVKSDKLYWGETFKNDIYTVEAYDFPRTDIKGQIDTPYVGVNLYKNGELVYSDSMIVFDDFKYDGEVKVTVTELMKSSDIHWQNDTYEPWAKIEIALRGLPDLDIDVETEKNNDKDTFKLTDSKIPVTINMKNKGDAPLEDINIYIDINGLKFYQFSPNKKLQYKPNNIISGASIAEIYFELSVPSHMKDTEYNINVNVTGIDQKDEMHNFTDGKEITVLNMINITKTSKSDIFMTDTAFVQLTIKNDGTYPVNNIELRDSIGDYFELVGSSPLQWNFNLAPGTNRNFKYTIKPVKPDTDGYKLPAANAKWEVEGIEYNQISIKPEIIVHGSKILLEKTVSPTHVDPNENVTVTITATNVGDIKASVEIFDNDPLPDNVTLVSGKPYTESPRVVDEEDSISLTYIINASADGIYELPQAKAKFYDLQGYRSEEISASPEFIAGNPPLLPGDRLRPGYTPTPTPPPTPIPSPTREQPGFTILAGLIGLSAAVLLALRR